VLEFLWRNLPNLLIGFPGERPGGLLLTILLASASIVAGFGLALPLGSMGASRWWLVRRIADVYVAVFRGLPLLLLLLLVHQVASGRFGLDFSPLTSAGIALTLYAAAYFTEVIRAGLLAVPREMMESARTMGAGFNRQFLRIRLRYAVHKMMPALANETITVFKDSSVVVVLGVADLMTVARATLGSSVKNTVYWVPMYLLVGLMYASVALLVSRGAVRLQQPRITS
jgi:His/Glu/Gln/Arg/opine family amino acid ABC transporter permease subunit